VRERENGRNGFHTHAPKTQISPSNNDEILKRRKCPKNKNSHKRERGKKK
jgi:hypothetical protein